MLLIILASLSDTVGSRMHLVMLLAPKHSCIFLIGAPADRVKQVDVHSMSNIRGVGCFARLYSIPPSLPNCSIHCATEMVHISVGIPGDSGD